jgi:hypothetical protein
MVTFDVPDRERLEEANEVTVDDLPRFASVVRHRDPPQVGDVAAATRRALEDFPALSDLPDGATVAVTAGSRGINDIVEVLRTVVETLKEDGLDPFVVTAMGSHGGATPSGQSETLAALGITEESVGCEIRNSMAVREVGTDSEGDPVFVSADALEADAILLVNRVKAHTDYVGSIESGLSKMAAIGLGKHRGAEAVHNASLRRGFDAVIPDRASVVIEESPVVGGLALLENANKRLADVVGVATDDIL